MPTIRAVFDASVFLGALLSKSPDAQAWLRRAEIREIRAQVPELVFAEVAHGLRRAVLARWTDAATAYEIMREVEALPVDATELRSLSSAALATAVSLRISGYDAFYVVLAQALDVMLVTADRRLAEAYDRVELLA